MAPSPLNPSPLPEQIRTRDLILQRNDPALAEEIFAIVEAERERLAFLPWVEHTQQVLDTRAYLERTRLSWDNNELFDYQILVAETGACAGLLGLHSISWKSARAELGYWLAGAYEGRGFMSQAVSALEEAAFDMGFHRLEIRCAGDNLRSAAVAERLGYKLEGMLRANVLERGMYRDTLVFGKLASERRGIER